jgi:hypothetical protein
MLVARIGMKRFYVGGYRAFGVGAWGKLKFKVRDTDHNNNSGAYKVSVTLIHPTSKGSSRKRVIPREDSPIGLVGVPPCDRYLENYARCLRTKVPAASRAMMEKSLNTTREAWRKAVATEAGKAGLAQACNTASAAAGKAMKAFGCEWGNGSGGILHTRIPKAIVKRGAPRISGQINANAASAIIRRGIGAIRMCYQRRLKSAPHLKGRLDCKLSVGSDGSVVDVNVAGTLNDPQVTSCIKGYARRWKFPTPRNGRAEITVPFVFTAVR